MTSESVYDKISAAGVREAKAREFEQAKETLLRCYPRGSTVYTILRHVSRSGMQRHISVLSLLPGITSEVDSGPEASPTLDIRHPNWSVSKLIPGYRLTPRNRAHDALIVNGCGMDMGFDVAYNIASALYGDGYALNHRWL